MPYHHGAIPESLLRWRRKGLAIYSSECCDTYVCDSVQDSELGSKQSTKAWSQMVTRMALSPIRPRRLSRFKGEFGYR